MAHAARVYQPTLWLCGISNGFESEGFCADDIYLRLGSNLLGGDLLSGDLHTSLSAFTILFFFICLLLSLGGSAFLAQVSGLSTCPTGLSREPGGVIPLPFPGIALHCESLGVGNVVELGPKFQARGSCALFSGGDALVEDLEVPVGFVGWRGTFE